MHFSAVAFVMFALALLTGCTSTSATYWLNPDGSGKVEIAVQIHPEETIKKWHQYMESAVKEADFETEEERQEALKEIAQELREQEQENKTMFAELKANPEIALAGAIQDSEGVEVWKDIHFSYRKGIFSFKGIAYFRSISELSVGYEGFTALLPNLYRSALKDGQIRVDSYVFGDPAKDKGHNPEKVDIDYMRGEWELWRWMVETAWCNRRMNIKLLTPWKVHDSTIFKEAENALTLSYSGETFIPAFRKNVITDAWLRAGDTEQEIMICQDAFKVKSLPTATFVPDGKPLFDYNAEVRQAKAAWPTLKKKLKLKDEPGEETGK